MRIFNNVLRKPPALLAIPRTFLLPGGLRNCDKEKCAWHPHHACGGWPSSAA